MVKILKINQIYITVSLLFFICFVPLNSEEQNTSSYENNVKTIQINPSQNEEPSKKNNDEKENLISLNFENATLSSVVTYVTDQLNKNYVPNKSLDGIPVTLITHEPMPPEKIWNILLMLLEANGFTINDVEGLHRISPLQTVQTEPLPFYSSGKGMEPENLSDDDTIIRYVYFLKNLNSETAASILDSMLTPNSIKINKSLEACIITERSYYIKEAMKIVKMLDEGGSRQTLKLITLKNVDPDTIQKIFNEIIGQQEQQKGTIKFIGDENKQSAYFSSSAKMFSLPRKNALILMGREENLDKIIEFIYKYLDIPLEDARSRIHIKEIQYANAEKLKIILTNIIQPPRGQAAGKGLVGEYQFFEDVIIALESSQGAGEEIRGKGNRLIIACNEDDWIRLDKFIDKLDKPQPQIALEIMIVDVSINKDRQLSAELRTKIQENRDVGFKLGQGIWGQTFNLTDEKNLNSYLAEKDSTGAYKNQAGFPSFLTVKNGPDNQKNNIWALIKAKFNIDNSNIIAQPFLTVNNYQECILNDIINRRVKGRILQTPTYSGNTTESYEYLSATTKITITPYTNLNGIIDLKIDLSVEDFTTEAGIPEQKKSTRTLKTKTTMAMGEVLVLGGLTKNGMSEKEYKTPILGDIPILGNLFKSKEKSREERNLYIFIRPSIIKPQPDGGPDEYTQLKLDYAKYQILSVDSYYKEKDPIQRWFFKPENQKIKGKLEDAAKGIFRPIDDFTYGKEQPKLVDIKNDIYYRSSEEIEKLKKQENLINKRNELKKRLNNFDTADSRNNLKRRNTSF
ncbi:MAG: hypothetical protein ABIA74_04155 [bacterium]